HIICSTCNRPPRPCSLLGPYTTLFRSDIEHLQCLFTFSDPLCDPLTFFQQMLAPLIGQKDPLARTPQLALGNRLDIHRVKEALLDRKSTRLNSSHVKI